MPITEGEWASIRSLVDVAVGETVGNRGSYFTTGKVIKRDEAKRLVWLEDFGDQAIPLVGFKYEIKYYDETPNGTVGVAVGAAQPFRTRTKTIVVTPQVPKVGEIVVVAREMGTRRLPRCLGVILGKDWVTAESE